MDASLGHLAVFCCDAHGGDAIGIKWRPLAFQPAPFRVATAHTSMLVPGSARGLCIPSLPAVLEEILQLSAGMVADIMLC